jgi:hypothetical protein
MKVHNTESSEHEKPKSMQYAFITNDFRLEIWSLKKRLRKGRNLTSLPFYSPASKTECSTTPLSGSHLKQSYLTNTDTLNKTLKHTKSP